MRMSEEKEYLMENAKENNEKDVTKRDKLRFNSRLKAETPPEDGRVLDPDNPLLQAFQKALKDHLQRQIDHLQNDVFEYECGIKKNTTTREELGVQAYEEQQIVAKQQSVLDSYITHLASTRAAREELQTQLQEKKSRFKAERDNLFQAEAEDRELRNEIEATNLLVQQVSQWEEALESDLTVKKRIYEKSRKDKLRLIEEKRQQDALIYKLMTRIWTLERQLERMDVQLKVKEEEREEMAQTVALGNTNIEAIEAEYRALMHSWNSVIVAVGNRDKVLACLGSEYKKVDEKFKSIQTEIEQVKKLTGKEMKKNEDMTLLKNRFLNDIETCRTSYNVELDKKTAIESRIRDMQTIIDQTEQDIDQIKYETQDSNSLVAQLQRDFAHLERQKSEMEEKIFRRLEERLHVTKTNETLRRILVVEQAKNREMEIQVATVENKIAYVVTEIETQKFTNCEKAKYKTELDDQMKDLDTEDDTLQDQVKKLELMIVKKQRDFDLSMKKLQKLQERAENIFESPLETRIQAMEKSIEEIQDENKKLQQFWLREQTNLLKISEERQKQLHNNNLLRKQIMIMEQKNLKVGDHLEAQNKLLLKTERTLSNLHNRLQIMSNEFCKKKAFRTNMDQDTDVLRQDYVNKLKDAELECLQLQDDIATLEEDKVTMSKELIEMNRAALEWEKRFLGAKEAKVTMMEEQGKEGEVGSMKAEIHRMQVRYGQLKKVQDVLIHDLNSCVARRDAIYTVAEAREKRTKGGMEKTRFNFNRRLDDLKNRLKQMENEQEDMDKRMETMEKDKVKLLEEIANFKEEIEKTRDAQNDVKQEIEEARTRRQMSFELLLQLQRKLGMYNDVAQGRRPSLLFRSETVMVDEYAREREFNGKLGRVLENLMNDFPNLVHELKRLMNSLQLPIYVSL